jgi:hypothetical protein
MIEMKVKIIRGPYTDKNIQTCYEYLASIARRELSKEDSELRSFILRDINKN